MFGKMTKDARRQLWVSGRFFLCTRGVRPTIFYRNFLMGAAKATNPMLASYEDRMLFFRTHVERYAAMGLDRQVLKDLLFAVLTIKLPEETSKPT